jgi:hypothetical protein
MYRLLEITLGDFNVYVENMQLQKVGKFLLQ